MEEVAVAVEEDLCNSVIQHENYDLNLHITALFVVLIFSFLGTCIPLLFQKKFTTNHILFQAAKLFGAGVILSTAWVHMQTEAYESFANTCLPEVYQKFSGFASLFAMIGIIFTHFIQILANQVMFAIVQKQKSHSHLPKLAMNHKKETSMDSLPSPETIPSPEEVECRAHDSHVGHAHEHVIDRHDHGHDHSHGGAIMHSSHITVYMLEFGIAFHSILIGIALGVTSENFQSLFTALVFHQFFEGIALSSVVAEANFEKKTMAMLITIFYTITTPIGIAIGIGIHEHFNENATGIVLLTGIMDALSAGILIYDCIVNIAGPHFQGTFFRKAGVISQMTQFFSFWLGCAIMAVIGLWA